MSKAEDIKSIIDRKGTLGVAELFTAFKNLRWNNDEFENLFATTTELMEKVPTDLPIKELSNKLNKKSPVISYNKRIHTVYKKNSKLTYKVEKKKFRYSTIILPFVFATVYIMGSLTELVFN